MLSWFAVFIGGGMGALARFAISQIPALQFDPKSSWPLATLLANYLGCGLAGWLASVWISELDLLKSRESGTADKWRPLLSVGFLGGFTTFSAFSLESLQLLQQGRTAHAICYVLISVLGSIACAALGFYFGVR